MILSSFQRDNIYRYKEKDREKGRGGGGMERWDDTRDTEINAKLNETCVTI